MGNTPTNQDGYITNDEGNYFYEDIAFSIGKLRIFIHPVHIAEMSAALYPALNLDVDIFLLI